MHRPRPTVRRALTALLITVFAAACSGTADGNADVEPTAEESTAETPTAEAPTAEAPTAEAPTEAADAAFPREVEHALGTAEIPERPERIVALEMSLADATLALGRPLLGYTLYQDPDGDLPDYFDAVPDELTADAQYLGELLEPDLEAIAAADPDVILTSAVRHQDFHEELSAIAPTIQSESTGTRWKENIRLAAQALGEEDAVDEVLGAYEERAAAIGAAIDEAYDEPVVSVVRFRGADEFSLYQRASFVGIVLDDAGLARPENQQSTDPETFRTDLSVENLPQADEGADVFFYTFPGNDDLDDPRAEEARGPVSGNPLWAQLPTVQSGDAHEVSEEIWMSAVGLFGANAILDDLAETFGVDPLR